MSAELAAFVFGVLAGGGAVLFHLNDRIRPKEKKRYHCRMCNWRTEESVKKEEGNALLASHLATEHKLTSFAVME